MKAVKFGEDFHWYYSRIFGTDNEIQGYRNTLEVTKVTQGKKKTKPKTTHNPTSTSLPPSAVQPNP